MQPTLDPMLAADPDAAIDPFTDPNGESDGSTIQREPPEVTTARHALVSYWQDRVTTARDHWEKKAFRRMKDNMAFAAGRQWTRDVQVRTGLDTLSDPIDDRYVANITLRHIHQRTATIYGKNPRIVARRKERILNTVWDGTMQSLNGAMQTLAAPQIDPLTGAAMPDPNAMAMIQDAIASMETGKKLERIARTLEILMQHELDEQTIPFKMQMKAVVRRTLTTGVGYLKLGYQRIMDTSPDPERAVNDMSNMLATVEQLSGDLADSVKTPDDMEAEQLSLIAGVLSKQTEIVVREGLALSYPDSNAVIPDVNVKQLRGFVGAEWVAEQYFLNADKIKQTYNVDPTGNTGGGIGVHAPNGSPKRYVETGNAGDYRFADGDAPTDKDLFCVWEVYSKADGMVYVLLDGYKDFLIPPAAPDPQLERFYPWFVLAFNETYDPETVFPPSDVTLMQGMQEELNRARQGLREHRRAARPITVTRKGALEQSDMAKITGAEANEVVEVNGLQPQEKIQDVLQPLEGPRLTPELYDTSQAYEDIFRVLGQQEANFGGTSGATATEVSTAEGSRMSSVSSAVDDLDEMLCEFARAAGQLLLKETSVETVKQVVGPGAVWPDMSREEINKEIYLDVEAASTGRPNKAQEIQNAQQLVPLLLQIPGISPEWIARQLIQRLDDRLDISDAFAPGIASIANMNRGGQTNPGTSGKDPNAQGAEGENNTPSTQPAQVNQAPRPGTPPPPVA